MVHATLVFLVLLAQTTQAAFPPNHFLGTCLTKEWVKSVEAQLGISSTERDRLHRLVHPFLRPALEFPRYDVIDPRTARPDIFSANYTKDGSRMYGVGAEVNASGKITKQGKVNNTLIVEMHAWASFELVSNVFAILATEIYGYEVSYYYISDSNDATQRMSSVHSGLRTPVHVNLEVWTAGKETLLNRYANESIGIGSIGYFGRAGLYTTRDFIQDMLDTTKYPTGPYYATYWNGYKSDEPLIQAVPVSTFKSNALFYPPKKSGCPDGVRGCLNHCSKSAACTAREQEPGNKECIVVVMMYEYYDVGYLQAAMSNIGIPAYFCFIGYGGAIDYAVYAQKNKIPVLFYHYEPDLFHTTYAGLFDRVFLPRPVPERVVLATRNYGELGYGNATTNPVDVDFASTKLVKYASLVLSTLNEGGPVNGLLSKMSFSELNMNDMLRTHSTITLNADEPTPEFQAACKWLKENYNVWRLWLDRLPLCTFNEHIDYQVSGCEESAPVSLAPPRTNAPVSEHADGIRTITFSWKTPDPNNASLPYACDGGLTEYPPPLKTSRSCAWIHTDSSKWIDWIDNKPTCDTTFYNYNVSTCDSSSKRTVHYYWLLPDPADPSKSLECEIGTVALPADVLVDCEYLPFSTPLFQVFAAIDGVIIAAIVGLMAFVFVCRTAPIIKRSQYELLLLMLFGGVLVCLSALVYAGEPSYFLCAARPLLVSSGFTTIFGALFVKSLRVYRVFMKSAMKRVTITMLMMVKVLSVFYTVDVIIIGVWFGADFPNPTVTLEQAKEFRGTVSRIACTSESFIFSALLMFWKAIVLFLGIYTSFLIRNVSADFQESIWIFSSSVMVLVGCLVILPLAYLVDMPAAPFYAFLAGSLLLCTVVVMSFMLVPKIFRLHAEATSSGSSTSSSKYATTKTAGKGASGRETGVGDQYSSSTTTMGGGGRTASGMSVAARLSHTVSPVPPVSESQ